MFISTIVFSIFGLYYGRRTLDHFFNCRWRIIQIICAWV